VFQYLNKKIRNNFLSRNFRKNISWKASSLASNSGQVAIVLMLVIAVALIFYAASLNVGRSGQTKTVITIASNTGAAMLASHMSSYGQSLFKQTLGGKVKICSSTGILGMIISFIIVVIVTYLTWGTGTAPAVALMNTLAIIGLALNFLASVIQVAIIQPGITSAWNKMTAQLLSREDRFLEQGIRIGLQNAVTDQAKVPDLHDFDIDRAWV